MKELLWCLGNSKKRRDTLQKSSPCELFELFLLSPITKNTSTKLPKTMRNSVSCKTMVERKIDQLLRVFDDTTPCRHARLERIAASEG